MSISKANLAQPAYNDLNWNTPLNSNFGIVTNSFGQITNVSMTTADVILSASQAQSVGIVVTGTMNASHYLLMPQNVAGMWFLSTSVTGGFPVLVAANNGSNAPAGFVFTAQPGYFYMFWSDGTNVFNAANNVVEKSGGTMVGALNLPANGLNVGSGQLQVTGGNVTTSGQFIASNNVTAYSDERLKENVQTINDALHRVRMMRGVTFTMKETGVHGAGVIAQEMREALPEVVYSDNAGYMHVAYGNIVSVLIEAIKELEKRVEYLEKRK